MIKLLPDSVANQIAAGEVVQRPASVVKELMENAVDAGATQIVLTVRDAGKTLVQVKDNGCGMSHQDARMAFERHATSKISDIHDLENLCTLGFRGEALASIAAVAEVELRTRRPNDDLGLRLLVSASRVTGDEPVQCPTGSVFSVKNLFFNIPARRKFLKSDASELRHIINEFQRIAVCNLDVEFHFVNNGATIYSLVRGNLKQRLSGLFGKHIANSLIDVKSQTSLVSVSGVTGKPDKAKKIAGEQFFFVNNRFFRSAYLQKAVNKAYEQLLPQDAYPSYFLFFDIDPAEIDVNIHPQKTEIKFENEAALWQILHTAVRESLSKHAVAPSIIFDMDDAPDIPVINRNTKISQPQISVNRNFNPFKAEESAEGAERFYGGFDGVDGRGDFDRADRSATVEPDAEQKTVFAAESGKKRFLQIKNRYMATCVKSGLMLIDICRAHQRILFERFMATFGENSTAASQRQLFPESVELAAHDYVLFKSVCGELCKMGFDIKSFDAKTFVFCAMPAGLEKTGARAAVDEILRNIRENYNCPVWDTQEKLALSLAKSESVKRCEAMNDEEMEYLVNKLFSCKTPDIDAEGKPTISIISTEDIDRLLKH